MTNAIYRCHDTYERWPAIKVARGFSRVFGARYIECRREGEDLIAIRETHRVPTEFDVLIDCSAEGHRS